jgi:hypothetical protein
MLNSEAMKKITLIAAILLAGFAVNAGTEGLDIYPNPAHDEMYVQIPDSFLGITDISIVDLSGKVISQTERFLDVYDFRKTQLSVDDLPNGVYLLEITNNENEVGSEFMKQ